MSSTLASQVAAGEVVERPASVVKELVENSLDAGARAVRIEIRRGGMGMIRVTDDGCGMSKEDAMLCSKRHATSKLTSLEDLFEITHLGFRGEAIPSIASVSRFKLSTRRQNALEGWEIRITGGEEEEPRSSGVSPGTTIEVSDLFFNTPARRKFLKSVDTEASHVEHQIRLHALAFPQVRFTFKKDDQLVFDLPGTDDLRVRIAALTDPTTAAALIPIEETMGPGITVSGFLLPLSEARRTRKGQFVFMNTRPVEDPLINRAIRDGFGGFPTGLHPALYLYMEVEPALVDVNVHPAKKEVRFRRSADVVNTIVDAISATLQKHARQGIAPVDDEPTGESALPPLPPVKVEFPPTVSGQPSQPSVAADGTKAAVRPDEKNGSAEPVVRLRQPFTLQPVELRQVPATQGQLDLRPAPRQTVEKPTLKEAPGQAAPVIQGFSYLGVLHKQFALFESPEGLVLMHPKAARERIIFEQLRAHKQAAVPGQQLLDPVMIDLDPRDFDIIRQFLPHFDQAGLTITPFGKNTIRVESIPAMLEPDNAGAFLLELVDRLTSSEFSRNVRQVAYETFIAEIAKKSAWKEVFIPARATSILKDLLACEVPYCTPSGKPTLINYSVPEIKRKFGIQA